MKRSGATSAYDLGVLAAELIRDEGLRLKPYRDTAGKLTIGVGRNLDDRGISEDEARIMLQNDISICEAELDIHIPWWTGLTGNRKRALLNMCFNLGWPRLSGFKEMLLCLQSGSYARAAAEALDSKWARQVGDRALRISKMFREG